MKTDPISREAITVIGNTVSFVDQFGRTQSRVCISENERDAVVEAMVQRGCEIADHK
jgi:hypothetical protein